MPILLNHTTTIPLARTLAEIAQAVPVPVTFEHQHGRVSAVTFRYAGELYRLSPNVEGAWALLNQQKGLGPRESVLMRMLSASRGAVCCLGIDCDRYNHKKQEAETMNTNTPNPDPLTEDALKEGEPAIRLALEIAEWLRKLPPDEQRRMLADFEKHVAEGPPNYRPVSEALRRYLVRACLH